MYQVKRAIIMAAGKGTRMRELTKDTPKPMLKVNGKRIIDSIIEYLLENGIKEILIVVGYCKDRFREITAAYPEVRLIENPYYETANNISSLYVARDFLENAMIIEGDHYFFSGEPLAKEFEHTEYNVFWSDEPAEWVVEVDSSNQINAYHEEVTDGGWVCYGVSRWTPEDARKLKKYLEYEFEEKENRQIYWDYIMIHYYPEEFRMYIRKTGVDQQVELDSVEEIARLDSSYEKYIT